MNKKCFSLISNPVKTKQMWLRVHNIKDTKNMVPILTISSRDTIYTNHVLPKEITNQNTPDY